MAKALFGFAGDPRAALLLRQVENLERRVRQLEAELETSKSEAAALRALAEDRTIELAEEGALA